MRVYVAAPVHLDLTPLLAVLKEENVELYARDEFLDYPWQGRRTVDAVVAILDNSSSTERENILVECGITIGCGIPLLAFVEDRSPDVLFGRAQVIRLNGTVLRIDALRFHIGLFLKRVQLEPSGLDSMRRANLRDLDLMEFRRRLERLHELDSGESRIQYQAYEIWVRDLLETAGADISTPTDKEERGFDLAAAVPSMPSYFGPLIVEVKVVTSSRSLFDAALRLGDRVAKENISLGLLLFDDAKVQVPLKIEAVPRVVYLGFRQLLDALRNNSLARVVMDTRNEAVHRP